VQVQIDALEQVLQVENAIAASFEDFDFVVDAFDKASAFLTNSLAIVLKRIMI
jgi:tRNA A37 threonylcarbamoyladenosine dehydratase